VVRRAKPKTAPRRSFAAARRRALARLRKGLDLQWTPPQSRETLHDRNEQSWQLSSSVDYDNANAKRRGAVTRGSGNMFADLGLPDAAERQAKLRLACALNQVLEDRKLSQADAARVLGVTQPKVSAVRHYKLAGFSVERLMNLLTAVERDVEIVIRRKPRSPKGRSD
jgi:predicted XRE-type DNA-binding protein